MHRDQSLQPVHHRISSSFTTSATLEFRISLTFSLKVAPITNTLGIKHIFTGSDNFFYHLGGNVFSHTIIYSTAGGNYLCSMTQFSGFKCKVIRINTNTMSSNQCRDKIAENSILFRQLPALHRC